MATAAGFITYTQVSERLAAQVADCLDALRASDAGNRAPLREMLLSRLGT